MADPTANSPSLSQDVRQRRPLAAPYSYPDTHVPNTYRSELNLSPTTNSPPTPFPWTPYLSRWENMRARSSFPKRLLLRFAEVLVLAASIKIFAFTQHALVLSIDETWEAIGRRAQSPFSPISIWALATGLLAIAGWHVQLAQISAVTAKGLTQLHGTNEHATLGDEGVGRKGKTAKRNERSWGYLLGVWILPTYLVFSFVLYAYHLVSRVRSPVYIDTSSTNDSAPALPNSQAN